MIIKIKNEFVKREINNSIVIIPIGNSAKEINGIIELNATASYMWDLFEKDISERELVDTLVKQYNISREVAFEALTSFVSFLSENNLLE